MYLARLHGSHPGQRPKLSTGLSAYLAFTGGHLGPMADVFYSLALFIAILHCHNVAPSQPWQLLHELVGHALSNRRLGCRRARVLQSTAGDSDGVGCHRRFGNGNDSHRYHRSPDNSIDALRRSVSRGLDEPYPLRAYTKETAFGMTVIPQMIVLAHIATVIFANGLDSRRLCEKRRVQSALDPKIHIQMLLRRSKEKWSTAKASLAQISQEGANDAAAVL